MKHFIKVIVVALVLFAVPRTGAAQKIGHLDVDSLMKIWPAYQNVVDSLTRYQINAQKTAEEIANQIIKKRMEIDSTKGKVSPLIAQLQQTQLAQLESNYEAFVELAGQEVQIIQATLVDTLYKQLNTAITKVAKAKGYTYILDSSKGGQVMYANPTDDVFVAVCQELKITIPPAKPNVPAPK